MKTLGLIGGISWHSTVVYYHTINTLVHQRLGENHTARLILYSVDFADFKQLQAAGDWNGIEHMLTGIAQKLVNAGADCVMICSNTPHMIAGGVQQNIKVPLLHIAETTASEIVNHNFDTVGLLGTKFTMEQSFFTDRLTARGIQVLIPDAADRDFIHTSILMELAQGTFREDTKTEYLRIIDGLHANGAQAVILGCTEIGLLVKQSECAVKLLDTAHIHSIAAVDFALSP